jgi:sec-independent protein translocase protein TatC
MSKRPKSEEPATAASGTLLSHLIELRNRLVYCVVVVLVLFLAGMPFANDIYTFVASPLVRALPKGASMIATEVASPFLTPLRLEFLASIVVAIPFLLYHIWAFVAPGLYRHERRLVLPLVVSSVMLFYGGMAFAHFIVFPLVFGFLVQTAPMGVTIMTDIKAYLDFVIGMFFAFGIAFELPIAVILLARMGAIDPDKLARQRPYVILGIFIIAAILTPPDVISQTLLALPMIVLFEIGLFVARRMRRAHDAVAHGEMSDAEMTKALDDYVREQPPAGTGNPE